MDKKWMSADRLSKEYENGVSEFVKFAVEHAEDRSRMKCPCLGCCYMGWVDADGLKLHLLRSGIDRSYTRWIFHGEKINENVEPREKSNTTYALDDIDMETYDCDRVEEIAEALKEDLQDCPKMFERLVSDAEKPLYKGCTKFSRLSAVLKLYNLKAGNGWSDKSFTELLALLREMLPEDNVLPNRTYEAKKMLCSIGMSYDKIHAYPNDCVLFRNEYASLTECPKCGLSRYKKKLSPVKVLWYFPIIPRFKRMFRSETDARHLTWHADERIIDGKYRHPTDSPQWSKIDNDYPDFGEESRNLRLALSTDGMNPHGLQSISHTTWPVILMIYNLPPWLAEAMHISSMKDLNPKYANLSYFGVIKHIWVFDYEKFQIPIFGCKWVNSSGVRMDKSGFLQVDLNREGYKDEPFILASQAKQVFYVNDPTSTKWSIVLLSNKVVDDNGVDQGEIDVENESCIRRNESYNRNDQDENISADESYIRNDHDEGIWITSSVRIVKKQLIHIPTKKRKRC